MDVFLQHVKTPTFLFIFSLHPWVLLLEQMGLRRTLMCFCCSFIWDSKWDWTATPRQSMSTEAPNTSHVMPCLSQTASCGWPLNFASCCVGPFPFSSASSTIRMLNEWSDFCWKLAVRRQVGRGVPSSLAPELRTVRMHSSMSILQTWWNDGLLRQVPISEWWSGEPIKDEVAGSFCRVEQLKSTWVPTSLCWWTFSLMSVMDAQSPIGLDLPERGEQAVCGLRDESSMSSSHLHISGFFSSSRCVFLVLPTSSWNRTVSVCTGDLLLVSKVRPRLRRLVLAILVFTSCGRAVRASWASGVQPPPIVKPKVVLVLRLEVATRPGPTEGKQLQWLLSIILFHFFLESFQ